MQSTVTSLSDIYLNSLDISELCHTKMELKYNLEKHIGVPVCATLVTTLHSMSCVKLEQRCECKHESY